MKRKHNTLLCLSTTARAGTTRQKMTVRMQLLPTDFTTTSSRGNLIISSVKICEQCANCFSFWGTIGTSPLDPNEGLHPPDPLGYSPSNENSWRRHCVPGKLFARILLARVQSLLNKGQRPQHSGYILYSHKRHRKKNLLLTACGLSSRFLSNPPHTTLSEMSINCV